MSHSFSEVKSRSRRNNHDENLITHFFGARVSIFFSYIFINLGLSPNQVTGLFFLVGLIGSIFAFFTTPLAALVSYLLFRLHIVFDICDGEVARFTKKTSLNGAYWDYMIHCTLYPAFAGAIAVGAFYRTGDINLLLIAPIVVFIALFSQVVKNNFYRALSVNRLSVDEVFPKPQATKPLKKASGLIKRVIKNAFNFEGLMFGFLAINLSGKVEWTFHLLIAYSILNFAASFFKFLQFSKKGFAL